MSKTNIAKQFLMYGPTNKRARHVSSESWEHGRQNPAGRTFRRSDTMPTESRRLKRIEDLDAHNAMINMGSGSYSMVGPRNRRRVGGSGQFVRGHNGQFIPQIPE